MDHKRKAENLGFSTETTTVISELGSFSGLFDDMGMSSSAILDYSTFDDLEMLIRNNSSRDVPVETRSEVVNTPSSSSTEAAAGNDDRKKIDEENEDEDEDEDQVKTKKQLSTPKKKKKRKEREARFAFMTKSDVDHLDDGYRWRKYGQKAVKNSPFPRSYYRCTSTLCGVKKRVERSNEDPSTVVTTYEGTHTHPCPIMPRGSFGGIMPEIAASSVHHLSIATPRQMLPYQQQQQQQQQPYFHQNLTPPQTRFNNKGAFSPSPFCPSTGSTRDHGLLQDMLPSKMLKETKEGSRNQGFDEL